MEYVLRELRLFNVNINIQARSWFTFCLHTFFPTYAMLTTERFMLII